MDLEVIKTEGKNLIVPDKLVNPDNRILEAKECLLRRDRWFSPNRMVNTYGDLLPMKVTPPNVTRALCFMNTLIKILENRGHQIKIGYNESFVVIDEGKIGISLREKLKRVEKSNNSKYKEYDFIPTGKIAFIARIHYTNIEWKDGQLPLEKQMSKIIATLELKGEELKKERIESQKRRIIEAEKKRIQEERQRRIETEMDDFRNLLKKYNQWQDANNLRIYLNELERAATKKNKLTAKLQKWLKWARKKADWYDPIINAGDSILSDYHKENLFPVVKPKPFWSY